MPSRSRTCISCFCSASVPNPPRGCVRHRPSASACRNTHPSCLCRGRALWRATASSKWTPLPVGQRARFSFRMRAKASSGIRAAENDRAAVSRNGVTFIDHLLLKCFETVEREPKRGFGLDLAQQAAGVEQIVPVEQQSRRARSQRKGFARIEAGRREDGTRAAAVNQDAAGSEDSADRRQVLSVLRRGAEETQ